MKSEKLTKFGKWPENYMSIPYWMVGVHNEAVDEIDKLNRQIALDERLGEIILESILESRFEPSENPDYSILAEFNAEIKAERKDDEDRSIDGVAKRPAKKKVGEATIKVTGERRKIHPTRKDDRPSPEPELPWDQDTEDAMEPEHRRAKTDQDDVIRGFVSDIKPDHRSDNKEADG